MQNFTTEGWTATVSVKNRTIFFYHQKYCLMFHYENINDRFDLFLYKHVYFYQCGQGLWGACTNGVNWGCDRTSFGQEILPPIMSGCSRYYITPVSDSETSGGSRTMGKSHIIHVQHQYGNNIFCRIIKR